MWKCRWRRRDTGCAASGESMAVFRRSPISRPRYGTISGFGELNAVCPSAKFERTPAGYARPSVPPGTSDARW